MSDLAEHTTATLWCHSQLELGEGPRWVDGRLVLVDILSGRLYEADGDRPGPLRLLHRLDVPLGAVAPVAGSPGSWIAAAGTGIALLTRSGDLDWLARPADGGSVARRMNDGVCDPAGRFWAGCMAWDNTPRAGALFRVDTNGTVTQVVDGLTVPNGPAFSADGGTMYLADSARGLVLRFAVEPTSGELGPPETFLRITDGSPDGMTADADGSLWVAVWGRAEVRQYDSAGALKTVVPVPARQPTAPCLGGADGRRLFITTAGYGLGMEASDRDGSVFAVDVPTPGPPAHEFGSGRSSHVGTALV